jgi:hypothetical protein
MFTCTPETFGGDPSPGVAKSCYRDDELAYTAYTWCGADSDSCTLPAAGAYIIGHGAFGRFQYVTVVTNSPEQQIPCNNYNNIDPFYGVPKQCYYRPLF